MTMTEQEALGAMLEHHRVLEDGVASRAVAIRRAGVANGGYGPAVGELVTYLAEEVLTHALAEERTIYPAAAKLGGLAEAVEDMIAEHRLLAAATEALGGATSGDEATQRALSVATLFGAHVAKENELVLPRLLEDPGADLAELLEGMHRALEASTRPASSPGGAAGDVELDVRTMAPAGRHESIFATFDALGPGDAVVLVNDHDPKPLHYQLQAEHPGRFTWHYLESGPSVWRVRIRKAA